MRGMVLFAVAILLGAILAASAADARSRSSSGRTHSGASRGSSGDGGNCTRSSPCTGPRGGSYYYTPGGSKQYLPR